MDEEIVAVNLDNPVALVLQNIDIGVVTLLVRVFVANVNVISCDNPLRVPLGVTELMVPLK